MKIRPSVDNLRKRIFPYQISALFANPRHFSGRKNIGTPSKVSIFTRSRISKHMSRRSWRNHGVKTLLFWYLGSRRKYDPNVVPVRNSQKWLIYIDTWCEYEADAWNLDTKSHEKLKTKIPSTGIPCHLLAPRGKLIPWVPTNNASVHGPKIRNQTEFRRACW